MSESKSTSGKGKAFFDRGDQVAATGNWDFAIEMYHEGLLREPDNLERGYHKLREVAMNRKAQGGKGPGMRDQMKHRTTGKDMTENLANAAYLLAKEPGSIALMEQVLKAAWKLELPEVCQWIGEILLESQRQAKKPLKRVCVFLIDAMEAMELFELAVKACGVALQAAPEDTVLEGRLGTLGAQYTLQKGKYGEKGDFAKGVKDFDKQKELLQKDSMIKDDEYLEMMIKRARKDYEETPTVPGKISGLVDTLLKFEDEAYENEAIDILKKAQVDTGAYQFKMRVGDIRIRQMTRRFQKYRDSGDKQTAQQIAREQLAFEIEEFTERVANYPTDLALKYELGRRLFLAAKYDDAISALQQAQRDPRRYIRTMNYLGQAFMKKQWWQEAVDTFERALESDISEERGKELRYYLACSYNQMGNLEKAQEQFSHVAQIDFNFKDVRDRLEAVRTKIREQEQAS
ncbi:MAG: hypothetical protein K8S55_05425 [Phycisphaerae bacterium]|nr:hypothetical protein [Phycisphaerae bacterium]